MKVELDEVEFGFHIFLTPETVSEVVQLVRVGLNAGKRIEVTVPTTEKTIEAQLFINKHVPSRMCDEINPVR